MRVEPRAISRLMSGLRAIRVVSISGREQCISSVFLFTNLTRAAVSLASSCTNCAVLFVGIFRGFLAMPVTGMPSSSSASYSIRPGPLLAPMIVIDIVMANRCFSCLQQYRQSLPAVLCVPAPYHLILHGNA